MRKFLLLMALVPLFSFAQDDEITEICGTRFGAPYMASYYTLKRTFGTPDDALSVQNKRIGFMDKAVEGVPFEILCFFFVEKNGKAYLNECLFFNSFKTEEEAIEMRSRIAVALGKKFKLDKEYSNDGNIEYFGGTSPTNPNKYGFHIYISYSSGSEHPYYVNLEFGPYDYDK